MKTMSQFLAVCDALQYCFVSKKPVKIENDETMGPHFGYIRSLDNGKVTIEYDDAVIVYEVKDITDVLYF